MSPPSSSTPTARTAAPTSPARSATARPSSAPQAAGIDLRDALARHRSGEAVAALGDGIETGPTHTNVNDLFAIAIGEAD